MAIRTGAMRHRIAIEHRHTERGTMGGVSPSWVQVATNVSASIEPLNGRELMAAQQVHSEVTVRIRIRYRPGITSKMRVVHKGEIYSIQYPINLELRNRELQLMCSVGLNEG